MQLRATLMLALLAGALGCENSLEPVNGVPETRRVPLPPRPPLGACVDGGDALPESGSVTVEGRVVEVGLGAPKPENFSACPWGDRLRFGAPSLGTAEMLAQTSWLRLSDADDREIVVSALAEGFAFPVERGDGVRATIDIGVGLDYGVTSFEARAADGALLFWIGVGHRLVDLEPPPEVDITLADVEQTVADDCVGSYQIRSLNLNVGEAAAAVRTGARTELGPWMLVNAVTTEQTGMTTCPDAFADQIQVAVWTLRGRVPETGASEGPATRPSPSRMQKARRNIGAGPTEP